MKMSPRVSGDKTTAGLGTACCSPVSDALMNPTDCGVDDATCPSAACRTNPVAAKLITNSQELVATVNLPRLAFSEGSDVPVQKLSSYIITFCSGYDPDLTTTNYLNIPRNRSKNPLCLAGCWGCELESGAGAGGVCAARCCGALKAFGGAPWSEVRAGCPVSQPATRVPPPPCN